MGSWKREARVNDRKVLEDQLAACASLPDEFALQSSCNRTRSDR